MDAKTNEHKAALELLGILLVKVCIFTGDAAFCQRDFCEKVIDGGGDYVLTVKDNQPSLAIDIAAGLAFEDEKRRRAAASPPTKRCRRQRTAWRAAWTRATDGSRSGRSG